MNSKPNAMLITSAIGSLFSLLTLFVFFAPGSLRPFDAFFKRLAKPLHTPNWSEFFSVIAFLGSVYGIVLVSVIAVVVADFNPLLIERGLVAVVGSAATAQIVKILVARTRPERLAWRNVEPEYSYPSGHSAAALSCYGLLAWYVFSLSGNAFISAVFALTILGVGVSRLALSVHHASDVLGGYLLAFSWLSFALVVFS